MKLCMIQSPEQCYPEQINLDQEGGPKCVISSWSRMRSHPV